MPNRILKESICTSDNIDKLTPDQERFFYRLLVNCDDFGYMDARPKILKAKCFPLKDFTESQLEEFVMALESNKLITLYTVGTRPYLKMNKWDKHQQIRAKRSKYPTIEQATDIICNQVMSNVPVIQSNPIQSNPNPNPNPTHGVRFSWHVYQKEVGRFLTSIELERLNSLEEDFGFEIVNEAITRAVVQGVRTLRYIEGILSKWQSANCRTLQEVLDFELRVEQQKKARKAGSPDVSEAAVKSMELEQKAHDETVKAATSYIIRRLGRNPPKEQAEELAKGYGEQYIAPILESIYGGANEGHN